MNVILIIGLLVILIGKCYGDDRFSQVRMLSAQDYGQGHNLQHSFLKDAPVRQPTRALFSWDIETDRVENDNEKKPQKKYHHTDPEVRNINRRIDHKLQNDEGNVWWPWKNYEDWLVSHRRKKGTNDDKFVDKMSNTKSKALFASGRSSHRKHKKQRKSNAKKRNKKRRIKSKARNNIKTKLINFPKKSKDSAEYRLPVTVLANSRLGSIYKGARTRTGLRIDNLERTFALSSAPETEKINPLFSSKENKETTRNFAGDSFGKTVLNKKANISTVNDLLGDKVSKPYSYFTKYWKHPVFAIAAKNYTQDDNECLVNNGGCEGLCINTVGSFRCHCPPGFRLSSSGKKCLDINECFARNGHGACQGQCTNTWGSFRCSCDSTPGTRLAEDMRSCTDIDECNDQQSPSGCSHSCVNTIGSAFCTCPAGYMLGPDWKTCQDVDECSLQDLQDVVCSNGCENTIGSYRCL